MSKVIKFTKRTFFLSMSTVVAIATIWIMVHRRKVWPALRIITRNTSNVVKLSTVVTPTQKPEVEVFVNIPVAGHLTERRQVIRNTWLSTARNYSIAYRFFTDGIDIEPERMALLKEEQKQYKDLELLPTRRGYWFSHRYLFALFWAYEHYDFKFYVRVDDDYFVCLNNLMNDLQYRRHEKLLYWGWFGCDYKMVAMDEGFLLTSVDFVEELMKRNNSLRCHPMGGQMVAMWVNRLESEGLNVTYFPDNTRIAHYRSHLKQESKDICKGTIGIHQSYPIHMKRYWNLTRENWFSLKRDDFVKVERKEYAAYCKQPKGWDWRVLNEHWRHEPKPCWEPGLRWPELEKFKEHKGREGD